MTRTARKKSSSGIYHLVVRGINRQNIFEYPEDREKYLDSLKIVKGISGFKLYGYCLLDNHVHLLIGEEEEGLDIIFKRLGARYVMWFNRKYERVGALFQGRYHSEAVEDDSYLLATLRYIHQNPVKAGLCENPASYRWSSYSDYCGKGIGITDTTLVLEQFSSDITKQKSMFADFMIADDNNYTDYLDVDTNAPDALKRKMTLLCGVDTATGFQALDPAKREEGVRMLRRAGLSIRQIVRLTGVSFGVVRKIGK